MKGRRRDWCLWIRCSMSF